MDNWLIDLVAISGVIYYIGGMLYIIHYIFNNGSFLCKKYKDTTTKVGFIIFLIIDIAMLPWTLMYYLFNGIIVLLGKIIFKEDSE